MDMTSLQSVFRHCSVSVADTSTTQSDGCDKWTLGTNVLPPY